MFLVNNKDLGPVQWRSGKNKQNYFSGGER